MNDEPETLDDVLMQIVRDGYRAAKMVTPTATAPHYRCKCCGDKPVPSPEYKCVDCLL